MKLNALLFVMLMLSLLGESQTLFSPDMKIQMEFSVNTAGEPIYSLIYKNQKVIKPSKLGLELRNSPSLLTGFSIQKVETTTFDESWKPVWGEVSDIRSNYNELFVTLVQNSEQRTMNIRFRMFNDGLGFRYEFVKQPHLNFFTVADERTQFSLTGDHKTFWMPGDYDTNEYAYTTTKLSEVDASKVDGMGIGIHNYFAKNAVQTPLLLKTAEGLYISIFEAALVDYSAMHLLIDPKNFVLTSSLVPDAFGTKAYLQTPNHTPWRTIIVSDKATDLLASRMILNLNEPSKIADPSFIHPQKFIGIWWGMHVPNNWTWNYTDASNVHIKDINWGSQIPLSQHGAKTENVMHYIDFAAANGFASVLVEGWNIGWEDWSDFASKWKEDNFNFVTPYPDFNVKAIHQYAKAKGVKIVMHHETGASVANYERNIDKAIDFMKSNGYDAVKTGYVGWIIPRGEKHDGQSMVNHYVRVAEKMAENRIMLDSHETVRPTGLNRTYPNWMTCEAARGNEYNAWSVGNPPEHETILPFTRLMGGPMDYTPGIFEIKMSHYQAGNKCQVHTTLAKQLALYVTIYSPFQMAADLPENYEKHLDAFQFIKDVAVDWDDTKYLEAEPGDFVTIVRKAKGTSDWFLGAITDENSRTANIPMAFLDDKQWYLATIYGDAADANWNENPMAYQIQKVLVNSNSVIHQKLAPGGGVAISFKKVNKSEMKDFKKIRDERL